MIGQNGPHIRTFQGGSVDIAFLQYLLHSFRYAIVINHSLYLASLHCVCHHCLSTTWTNVHVVNIESIRSVGSMATALVKKPHKGVHRGGIFELCNSYCSLDLSHKLLHQSNTQLLLHHTRNSSLASSGKLSSESLASSNTSGERFK